MGESFPFFDILLLAMIAAFIALRLRSVLGRRTGHEQQNPPSRVRRDSVRQPDTDVAANEDVIPLPDRGADRRREPGGAETPLEAALTRIKIADTSFDSETFLSGARAAYEVIVTAFARGDIRTLQPLLDEKVRRSFTDVIESRKKAGQTQETTLVGIKSAEIVDAELEGRLASVTVKFVSDMISATKDAAGEVIAGDATKVTSVTDIWTFKRDVRSRDPNWLLAATRSAH